MRRTLGFLVLTITIATVFTSVASASSTAKPDDCAYYADRYSEALSSRNWWSAQRTLDEYSLIQALTAQDTPFPIIDGIYQNIMTDNDMISSYQSFADGFWTAMGQACGVAH